MDRTILHEDDVRAVVVDEMAGGSTGANAAITNASVANALNSTFSDTEVEAALNANGAKINLILAALRNSGIIAP